MLKKENCMFWGVDQSKAFDNISHEYVFSLLDHMNLGNFISRQIKNIYNDSYAYIEINKCRSNRININLV